MILRVVQLDVKMEMEGDMESNRGLPLKEHFQTNAHILSSKWADECMSTN